VRRVEGFTKQFGQPHRNLARHAAFPLVLTPDLLYQIWASFVTEAPWTAVAHVLLSRLCRQVGYEMYQMDIADRNLLLKELQEDFGQERLNQLSEFLLDYVAQQLTEDDPDTENLREAQTWTALAYTKPTELAQELAEALRKRVKQKEMGEVLRLISLVETFAEPLKEAGFEPLLAEITNATALDKIKPKPPKNLPRSEVGRELSQLEEVVISDLSSTFNFPEFGKKKIGKPPENLPRSGVVKFVGREDAMNTLHEQLQQSERVVSSAVSGMGGIGKTELALQYAHQYKQERYPGGVCWLRARDENVGVQLVNYAKVQMELNPPDNLELDQQVAYCWRNWEPDKGDVLVILDDVVKYEAVADYLPPVDPRFKVLITTRQQWLGASFQRLELQGLDEAATLELLGSLVGESRIEAEAETAKALCEDLGRLPLGLELVGDYLKRKPDLSLEQMRQRLGLEHRSLEKTSTEMTAKLGVKATFELSWQELEADARILAGLLSLFAPAPISWSWVESCLPEVDEEDLEDIRDDGLVNWSLLQRNEVGTYQLYPLIREFLRDKLENGLIPLPSPLERGKLEDLDRIGKVGKILPTLPEDLKHSICQVMVAEAQKINETPTREDILAITPAIPHIAEVAEKLTDCLTDDDLISPFTGLGWFYQGQGFYSQAEPWHEQCLQVTQTRLGENHPLVASSLNNLAGCYYSQGRYQDAEPLLVQALEMRKRILGVNHPDVALSLNKLAELYRSQGRYSEAEPLYNKAIAIDRIALPENHPSLARDLNNLAELYRSQGRYSEAEPLVREAIAIDRIALPENHPSLATHLNNLAELYHSKGRYSEAEPLYYQVIAIDRIALPENHPSLATNLNNLASLYYSQGRYKEAEPLYR
jgi:tetratricopeptide (TPR) repeat protein